MISVEVEDNIDTISQLFPSFYQSSKCISEFLIHDTFKNVLKKIILDNVREVFELNETSAKVMLNDRYVTIEQAQFSTKIVFGEYVDYAIYRIYRGHASFWNNSTFTDSFEDIAVFKREHAEDLIKELSNMYNGDIAVIPLKKLLSIKKVCSQAF